MKNFVEVLAHRASEADPKFSFTYYTSQFPQWVINSGDEYIVEFENGERIYMKASRDGKTLYTGKCDPHSQPLPILNRESHTKNGKVVHNVVSIYKALKQLEVQ